MLTHHLKQHGAIHAIWAISILILIIAAILLGTVNGGKINEFISFASSLASLILAIVAIFYAMISNQSFSETIGFLTSSSNSIQTAANNLAATSASLNDRIEAVVGEVARVPAAMEELSSKFDAQLSATAANAPTLLPAMEGEDATTRLMREARYGTQVALYALAKSFVTRKAFDSSGIFLSEDKFAAWNSILTGFVLAIYDFKPCSITLSSAKTNDTTLYSVSSFGDADPAKIISYLTPKSEDDELIKIIDNYFEEPRVTPRRRRSSKSKPKSDES
jgi:hypothetical protein